MINEKRIVVLVSGGGTNLQALIDAQKNGELGNGKITCVVSSKADAYALTRAEQNGIKSRTLIRKDYSDIASYSKAMRDILLEEKADLIVYAGFMTILDENVCNAFENKMINVINSLKEYLPNIKDIQYEYCATNDKNDIFRKPNIGMINVIQKKYGVPLDESMMIGDTSGKEGQFSDSDKKCAENAGLFYMDINDFVNEYSKK